MSHRSGAAHPEAWRRPRKYPASTHSREYAGPSGGQGAPGSEHAQARGSGGAAVGDKSDGLPDPGSAIRCARA